MFSAFREVYADKSACTAPQTRGATKRELWPIGVIGNAPAYPKRGIDRPIVPRLPFEYLQLDRSKRVTGRLPIREGTLWIPHDRLDRNPTDMYAGAGHLTAKNFLCLFYRAGLASSAPRREANLGIRRDP